MRPFFFDTKSERDFNLLHCAESAQVLIFLFIFVYALAVVLTRMVGHQKKSEDEDVQEVMEMFSNVGVSLWL